MLDKVNNITFANHSEKSVNSPIFPYEGYFFDANEQ